MPALTPEQQKLLAILDYAFPITKDDRQCRQKMQKKEAQRKELTQMIEAYKRGEKPVPSPLTIKINLEELYQKLYN